MDGGDSNSFTLHVWTNNYKVVDQFYEFLTQGLDPEQQYNVNDKYYGWAQHPTDGWWAIQEFSLSDPPDYGGIEPPSSNSGRYIQTIGNI